MYSFVTDKTRNRQVVFYGRVSTEHEAQLSALENQLQWYDNQAEYHSNWNVHNKYIDEGITGTQAKKRPAFMKMLEDAKKGMFDLIVTREVCRFARNTVDTLVATRELKNLGVEVYFVEDNIWTMDGDGELRLTIMATLAQEESRKISERVRAGQKISRDNGVLYGSGNIIGYDRLNGTYVINQDQAETVRLIFDMYFQGLGEKRIVNELYRLQRKDGHGNVSWTPSKISRVLRNATYKGYKCYNKSHSNNFLEQKRIRNLDDSTYIYVKGDFEPLVSEEVWNKCDEIRKTRVTTIKGLNGKPQKFGKICSKDVWMRKLKCHCGATFKRYKWRTNKTSGLDVYGYQCYRRSSNVSISYREKNGLATEGICDIRGICDWKLEFMAKKIIESVWTDRKAAVLETFRILNECVCSDTSNNQASLSAVEGKISRARSKIDSIINMRAEGDISKDEFRELRSKLENELNIALEEREKLKAPKTFENSIGFDLDAIEQTLNKLLDFSMPTLDNDIVEKFVECVTPMDNNKFIWILNFEPNKPQEVVCGVNGRKNKATFAMDEDESPLHTYSQKVLIESDFSVNRQNTIEGFVLHRQFLNRNN
ncbi:MAG TPA: recombinase family protein [Clostridia bacterium]|nr:recombinase family protein [Clostridia bacterium]